MPIHVVLVKFGAIPNISFPWRGANVYTSFHEVDTSDEHGLFVENINEAMEFSGYQEGLCRTLNFIKNGSFKQGDCHSIIFVNDTIYYGHLWRFVKEIIYSFNILGATKTMGGPNFIGLGARTSIEIQDISHSTEYHPTWIFMLQGTMSDLLNFRFYDGEVCVDKFHEKKYMDLPLIYREYVDSWLHPKSFFRGWYKAIPGKPLDYKTLRRKRYSIYLEHGLPLRSKKFGFNLISIFSVVGVVRYVSLRLLSFLDRLFVNFLKIKNRFGNSK